MHEESVNLLFSKDVGELVAERKSTRIVGSHDDTVSMGRGATWQRRCRISGELLFAS